MLCGFTPYTEHGNVVNEMEICRNITSPDFTFAFPSWLKEPIKEFVKHLLTRNPVERLGCGGGGVRDVMGHSVFGDMDFSALVCKSLRPPFRPDIASNEDTSNFDADAGQGFSAVDIAGDAPYDESPTAWDYYL